ncbi:MAG: GntR family transcriptional regulator [Deltaproteobacteria bacterium]|nr:GntR family transcriptional regulator [Deltaproteobacteria bacterium]MBW2049272.1 GntR family transcriptional regulator [Deltaproteobacteria bacterium]MBW2355021.1 GntR family transcriptional regulator [Deltaproteobacteria bacterium]
MAKGARIGLKHKISKELRDEIISGKLMPGEHLKETWLTEKFKCSRGPVREALIQLEREGFLLLVPNQGAVVTKMSPKEVEDFYAILELLEGKAVEWAAPLLGPEDIKQLRKINNDIRKISREDRNCIEDWIPLNLAFHRVFREKCGNDKLNWMIEEIRMRITRYRYTSLVVTVFDEYILDHEKIIKLVERGDAPGAGKAMEAHILRAKEILMDFLSRLPGF